MTKFERFYRAESISIAVRWKFPEMKIDRLHWRCKANVYVRPNIYFSDEINDDDEGVESFVLVEAISRDVGKKHINLVDHPVHLIQFT